MENSTDTVGLVLKDHLSKVQFSESLGWPGSVVSKRTLLKVTVQIKGELRHGKMCLWDIREQRWPRSDCADTQSDQDIRRPLVR